MKNIIIISPSNLCANAIKRYIESSSNCFNISIIEIPSFHKNKNDIKLNHVLQYFEIIVKKLETIKFSDLI